MMAPVSGLAQEILQTIAHYKALGGSETVIRHPETGEHVTLLKKGGAFCYIPDPTFHQPAVKLERRHGFTGLAQHYIFPGGLAPDIVETYGDVLEHAYRCGDISRAEQGEKLQALACEIRALNPDLAVLPINLKSRTQCYDLIQGATSAFNPQDIRHYMQGNSLTTSFDRVSYRLQYARLSAEGLVLGWVPSPLTLRKISQEIFSAKCAFAIESRKAQTPRSMRGSGPRSRRGPSSRHSPDKPL